MLQGLYAFVNVEWNRSLGSFQLLQQGSRFLSGYVLDFMRNGIGVLAT